jgi:radical SAM protein with 4Fe4S-binding SPASM domain
MQIIDTLIKMKQNGSLIINDQMHLSLTKRYFATNNPTMNSIGLQCHAGYEDLFIDECGNYRPCWRIDWDVGNIREKGIKEAWFSDKFLYIRSSMKKCQIPCLLQCHHSGSIASKIIELTHRLHRK